MATQTPKIEKIASPAATLRGMTKGSTMIIPTRELKASSLRSAAARLKKNGYSFSISELGLINEVCVMCIKSPR